MASECGRDDVWDARRPWRLDRRPRMREQAHRLIFIDETATTTKMTRLRRRALQGKRLRARSPFGHWKTKKFIAGLRCDGLTALDYRSRDHKGDLRGLCRNPARTDA